jgi:SAM-dependent methyltransferase
MDNAWELAAADFVAPDVGALWDLCLSTEYHLAEVVRSLVEWLGPPDGQRILDCACGSGFPALDLHRRGYQLTCTDASPLMLERFRRNARAASIALEPRQARWEELDELYAGTFDVVICRGCSLIYAGTFDADTEPDRSALECSIRSLARCLRPGGRLYVDTAPEESHNEDPEWTKHAPRTIHGHRVELHERVIADPEAGLRQWTVKLHIDSAVFDFERKSHYLPHAELVRLLHEAGLDDVARAEVSGERYEVFVGQRPVGSFADRSATPVPTP